MKKTLFSFAVAAMALAMVACNGKTTGNTGTADSAATADSAKATTEKAEPAKPAEALPTIESIDADWDKVTYADLGFSFEAPSGIKVSDIGRFELRAKPKGVFVDIVMIENPNCAPEKAAEFLKTFTESVKQHTKESKAEQKGATATIWEHKNGMQHHTRYIVGNGRYVKLIFYYFDKDKATLDKAYKRVLDSMKLEDPVQ